MAARKPSAPCAVCQKPLSSGKVCRVVVESKSLPMCRTHAAVVAASLPRTFEELRALFPEPATEDGQPRRRSVIERRTADDRRIFPPRPEGRRMSGGRRASDEAA
ncbi:MAG: hypothetical protein U0271_35135 [Polyangiaceae bacterium]